jgi:hypothetical protein
MRRLLTAGAESSRLPLPKRNFSYGPVGVNLRDFRLLLLKLRRRREGHSGEAGQSLIVGNRVALII